MLQRILILTGPLRLRKWAIAGSYLLPKSPIIVKLSHRFHGVLGPIGQPAFD